MRDDTFEFIASRPQAAAIVDQVIDLTNMMVESAVTIEDLTTGFRLALSGESVEMFQICIFMLGKASQSLDESNHQILYGPDPT